MGTDIHIVAQVRKVDGSWRDIDTAGYDIHERNYTWFTFLSGERSQITNQDRNLGITPIAPPRGAPEGFEVTGTEDPYDFYPEHNGIGLGYGVSSWVTLAEILEHERRQPHPLWPDAPADARIGPIDELERLFAGHAPEDCRIVFGYDC